MRYAVLLASVLASACLAGAPETPKKPVTDTHHGTKVVDDYRWLEDWNEASVKAWSDTQNAHARSVLDALNSAAALRNRFTELENSVGVEYARLTEAGGMYFAAKSQPPKQQPMIVALSSLEPNATERVLLDVNELDKEGGTSFDWFVPSPDGKLLAVSLSEGGSEAGNVHIYDVASGKEQTGDVVPGVNGGTAGGSMAWNHDSSGFYYTRYPRAGERPEADMAFYTQLYHHKLGTNTKDDTFQVGKDYPKIAEIRCEVSKDGNWVLTNVQNGDGGEFIQDIRSPDGTWTRLSKWEDAIVEAVFGPDGNGGTALYAVSRKGAPKGKVLKLALQDGVKPAMDNARTIIREQRKGNGDRGYAIQTDFFDGAGIWARESRLYVLNQTGGPNELHVFSLDGHFKGVAPTPSIAAIEGVTAKGDGDDLIVHVDSYITPGAHYVVSATDEGVKLDMTRFATPTPPRMPKLVIRREFATSKDGTKVPLNIITREGLELSPSTPMIVYGYGGYGVCETPGFSRRRLPWLEAGGAFVTANIRGGGEYGEQWHLEGNLTKKQNVFDDFAAACNYVVEKKYTSREKLAIMGGSNGGLLMGATITQHPDICSAVVSSVGIYDMLRVELSPNGEFNITEFGTVKNPDHFKALSAYSPYHHVKDAQKYPHILFMTGANDPRVDPMQSRKMTARLQAAQASLGDKAGKILLRTSGNTGHGAGTPLSARIEQSVDMYAFLFDALGVRPADATR